MPTRQPVLYACPCCSRSLPAAMGAGRRAAQAMFERNKWRILRGDKVGCFGGGQAG